MGRGERGRGDAVREGEGSVSAARQLQRAFQRFLGREIGRHSVPILKCRRLAAKNSLWLPTSCYKGYFFDQTYHVPVGRREISPCAPRAPLPRTHRGSSVRPMLGTAARAHTSKLQDAQAQYAWVGVGFRPRCVRCLHASSPRCPAAGRGDARSCTSIYIHTCMHAAGGTRTYVRA